mmetsp:Transcript_13298/g.35475  ORF Transcript_13298/g.35475 Transcript_13298/m.35475 type:complete len:357 (+) Transcript_13298:113-1183(+)
MARSISPSMCSSRFLSCAKRSFMRWISFCMALTSVAPTSGSRACCVSLSRAIFFSQSIISRSDSATSLRRRSFSALSSTTCASTLSASCSMSARRCTNSCSSWWLSLASVDRSWRCLEMSVLILPMSRCMASMPRMRSWASRVCVSHCWSMRMRFWLRMVSRERSSRIDSDLVALSFSRPTSSVWPWIHRRCISSDSSPLVRSSAWSSRMVASRGPMASSSSCWARAASSPAFSFMRSSLRLSTETWCSFFSISSLRLRISCSYFWMSPSLPLSSAICWSRRCLSTTLLAAVLSASTRILARSFSSVAAAISFSWTNWFLRSMLCFRFCADLSREVCSLTALSFSSSRRRTSCATF